MHCKGSVNHADCATPLRHPPPLRRPVRPAVTGPRSTEPTAVTRQLHQHRPRLCARQLELFRQQQRVPYLRVLPAGRRQLRCPGAGAAPGGEVSGGAVSLCTDIVQTTPVKLWQLPWLRLLRRPGATGYCCWCICWPRRPSSSTETHLTPPDSPAQLGWQAGYGKALVLQTVGLVGGEQAVAASSTSSSSGGIAFNCGGQAGWLAQAARARQDTQHVWRMGSELPRLRKP
jgi:hypothetical protein